MRSAIRPLALGAACALTLLSQLASAGVINNALIQWRGHAHKCEHPVQRFPEALMHVAMFEAINSIQRKYTPYLQLIEAPAGSSVEVAAARAAHDVLVTACPDQKRIFEGGLQTALEAVSDTAARDAGAKVGAAAAAAVLASRMDPTVGIEDPVFDPPAAGRYAPTMRRVGFQLARQKPWIMRSADEVRPLPPPPLASETWASDLEEVKLLGERKSKTRTAEQTDSAKFWVGRDTRSVLDQLIARPGRTLVDDARFLALAEMAHHDAYIAMMDGKYHYDLWRPITAIRHAETDGNAATAPNPQWLGLGETPPHPEFPCGHCLSAAAAGAVIANEFGDNAPPLVLIDEEFMLRRFDTPKEFVDDVAMSRIYLGVHYRFSVDAGVAMGSVVGNLASQRYFTPLENGTE